MVITPKGNGTDHRFYHPRFTQCSQAFLHMRILVQYQSYVLPVDTKPTATVAELAAAIPDAAKFHLNIRLSRNLTLSFRRIVLSEKLTLEECRLIDGSLLVADGEKLLDSSIIRLKTLTGRVYEYRRELDDSVGAAKQWISEQMGYPVERTRIICPPLRRELKDEELFTVLDLPPETILFVVARLGGGG
jgi:hypothetical protein